MCVAGVVQRHIPVCFGTKRANLCSTLLHNDTPGKWMLLVQPNLRPPSCSKCCALLVPRSHLLPQVCTHQRPPSPPHQVEHPHTRTLRPPPTPTHMHPPPSAHTHTHQAPPLPPHQVEHPDPVVLCDGQGCQGTVKGAARGGDQTHVHQQLKKGRVESSKGGTGEAREAAADGVKCSVGCVSLLCIGFRAPRHAHTAIAG